MARRDNQGIQIAMIVFILTTLLFMVGTYLGYSSWAAASSKLEQTAQQLRDRDSQMNGASRAADAMKIAIGLDPSLADETAEAEAKRWVEEVMGAGLPEESRNFLGIIRARDSRISDLNGQLAKSNTEVRRLNDTLREKEATAQKMVATAKAAEAAAVAELQRAEAKFQSDVQTKEQSLNKISEDSRAQVAAANKKASDATKAKSLKAANIQSDSSNLVN